MNDRANCIIMGAAGRDLHDFQTFFRANPRFHVVAFTAAQIPFIDTRTIPHELGGASYAEDIPVYLESALPDLICRFDVEFVFFAYSDLAHTEVMHKASLVQSCGAAFVMLGPKQTQLKSTGHVIAVTAVRTGAGKSPLTQWLARQLTERGRRVSVIRHPMPYGNLDRQRVEHFAAPADLDRYECTIEEREEYQPYLDMGLSLFAGVDYQQILRAAEAKSDVILWDGGNNDYSFIRADLKIVVADALRPGHETAYYPGETNLRSADVVVINKVAQADPEGVAAIRKNIRRVNPQADIVESDLDVSVDDPQAISGRRVLVVEDGPTLTHGGMAYGAGLLATRQSEAAEIIDPRPFAIGTIADAFREFPHLHQVLPALGYSPRQRDDLLRTIHASGAELVVDASPAAIDGFLDLEIPTVRVRYRFRQLSGERLEDIVIRTLADSS